MIPAALMETARTGREPLGWMSRELRAYVRTEYGGRGDYALFQIARAARERSAVRRGARVPLRARLDRAYRAVAGLFARTTVVRLADRKVEARP